MALIYGRNTTKQKTHYVVVRKTKDSIRRSGTDGRKTRPTGGLSLPLICRMLGWDTWTILQKKIDISHTAPHLQRNRYNKLFYLRSVDEDKRAPPLQQRPGYQGAKKALVDMHKQVPQDYRVTFIRKVERQRLRNQLDPSMQRYLEWLSTNWAVYFAEE